MVPRTVDEAVELLARHRDDAKVLAGGQSLIPLLNYRLARPRTIVDLNGVPLDFQRRDDGRLRLGALTRHATLIESPDVARACPILAEAASLVGNVRVRTLGTLGGSLAHADPAAELPLAMVALDARVTVHGPAGERTIDAGDFFTGYLSTALAPDELVTEVEVPPTEGMGVAIEEFSRRPGDFAVVAVVALVSVDARGRLEGVRLAVGGVGPTPVRVTAAEDALRDGEPSAERLARAAEVVAATVRPDSDAFVSAGYRRHLSGVLTRRALTRAIERALGRDAGGIGATGASGAASGSVAAGRSRAAGAGTRTTAAASHGTHPASELSAGVGDRSTRLVINGRARELSVEPHRTLLEVLRDHLGIFDVKEGCNEGVCGTCTVLLDGRPVSSCLVLAAGARGRSITTVRSLTEDGELHPLQQAFLEHGAVQCGFCTPGMLLTTLAFLERNPHPDRDAIRHALEGNLCRCTGYTKIVDAIEAYAREPRRG